MTTFVSPYNPTQQGGVRAKSPPDVIVLGRNPTSTDYGFLISQIWINPGNSAWILVGFHTSTYAIWQQISPFTPVSEFVWNAVSAASAQMVSFNGYVTQNSATTTLTLPANPSFGDAIKVIGANAGGFIIAQNTNDTIFIGVDQTLAGPSHYIQSVQTGTSINLICVATNPSIWASEGSPQGVLTFV